MGTMTGSSFDTDVRAILGAANTDLLPTATQLRFTNAAFLEDICMRWNPLELRTSTTANATQSQATYTPAISTCLKFLSIQNAAGQLLKELPPDVESPYSAPIAALTSSAAAETGLPTHYIRRGGAVYTTLSFTLFPTPDAAYPLTVYFVSRPAEVAAGTATTIDMLWDQAILYYAAARAAAFLLRWEDARNLREYANALATSAARAFHLTEAGTDAVAPQPAAIPQQQGG